jgi:hypothetical protein
MTPFDYMTPTKGYVFKSLWDGIETKIHMENFDDLLNFFVTYVGPAFELGKSCVITNQEDKVLFYLEKGVVKMPVGGEESFTNYLKMITGEN